MSFSKYSFASILDTITQVQKKGIHLIRMNVCYIAIYICFMSIGIRTEREDPHPLQMTRPYCTTYNTTTNIAILPFQSFFVTIIVTFSVSSIRSIIFLGSWNKTDDKSNHDLPFESSTSSSLKSKTSSFTNLISLLNQARISNNLVDGDLRIGVRV